MAGGGLGSADGMSVERVHAEVEAVLSRVVSAGRVAEVMWRLLHHEPRMRQRRAATVGGGQDGALSRLVWHGARDSIAATAHQYTPWVYHAAVRAACPTDDPDVAVLVLAELAGMHLRSGYAADGRRLIELAAAGSDDLGEQARRVLATVRGWLAEYERLHDIYVDHDEESGSGGHDG